MPVVVILALLAALIANCATYSTTPPKCSVFSRCAMHPTTIITLCFRAHYFLSLAATMNASVKHISAVTVTTVQFIFTPPIDSCGQSAASILFLLALLYSLALSTQFHIEVGSADAISDFLAAPTRYSLHVAPHDAFGTHRPGIHHRY